MKSSVLTLLFLFFTLTLSAQNANDKKLLTGLLDEFLEGASYNDPEIHDRFWAEDLIYTGSAGNRMGKSEIMSGMKGSADYSSEPEVMYHGEDVQINVYGESAVVAFKLVAVDKSSLGERMEFYNTGTFIKRNAEWKAVAWQATRIPE
ncbi:nuclear transport factor 2 family protein [Gracilimonas sp. Q87]|uniref:nuclear transport factor 2 family protein n=1 Tax=Gracilimonas sp. Q87 TaxID=3384766 RepID=UPI003983E653